MYRDGDFPTIHDIHVGRSFAKLSQLGDERMAEIGEREGCASARVWVVNGDSKGASRHLTLRVSLAAAVASLLTRDPVAIAIKMRRVAGLAHVDRRRAGRTGGRAVVIINGIHDRLGCRLCVLRGRGKRNDIVRHYLVC